MFEIDIGYGYQTALIPMQAYIVMAASKNMKERFAAGDKLFSFETSRIDL
jgi:hypothetical protein